MEHEHINMTRFRALPTSIRVIRNRKYEFHNRELRISYITIKKYRKLPNIGSSNATYLDLLVGRVQDLKVSPYYARCFLVE